MISDLDTSSNKINYVSFGIDCSPAAALRNLGIRQYALPFDWVQSDYQCITKCIEDDFLDFHCHLQLNHSNTRVVDRYGIQFPHDYPFTKEFSEDELGEGVFGEDFQKKIIQDWHIYYEIVIKKYKRRIDRFNSIFNDIKPIIILCRNYQLEDIYRLMYFLKNKYNKSNIYFVVSSKSKIESNAVISCDTERNAVISCDTERNGKWNDEIVWNEAIQKIITINSLQ
jgi:hypothetical protein